MNEKQAVYIRDQLYQRNWPTQANNKNQPSKKIKLSPEEEHEPVCHVQNNLEDDAAYARQLQSAFDWEDELYQEQHRKKREEQTVLDSQLARFIQENELRQAAGPNYSSSQTVVARLPTVQYNACSGRNEECVICCSPYKDDEKIKILPCMHRYHVDCIDPWLYQKGSCPVCQHKVIEIKPIATTRTTSHNSSEDNEDNIDTSDSENEYNDINSDGNDNSNSSNENESDNNQNDSDSDVNVGEYSDDQEEIDSNNEMIMCNRDIMKLMRFAGEASGSGSDSGSDSDDSD